MTEEYRKGTYTSTEKQDDDTFVVTERGFTFQEENGLELAFDVSDVPETGTALLFGNQIFFLKFWTDDQLDKASREFNRAIEDEKEKRNDSR